ncbi:hypothetical protein B0H16DRAFT_1484090 [Mycena metata]|uniref:Uncharacterized protein n=1 Tax=Mycena metata TaxID=1033252 RepID=A0AAD7DW90_9AGAR|nr:hypothetical protein B0H16DRAFT_1484090 [Mycena metata]
MPRGKFLRAAPVPWADTRGFHSSQISGPQTHSNLKSPPNDTGQRTYYGIANTPRTERHGRNKLELQRKARERMAKRRAELKKSDEAWAAYTAKAREDAARTARWAKLSIAKLGFTAWHEGYLRRHPRQPHVLEEDLPEWPESSDSETDASTANIPPPPPASAGYEAEVNYFLDYLDPTTAPDYMPKPGEQPYFQRGKRRWN